MDDTVIKAAWKWFQENIVADGNMLIDKRTGQVLDPEIDYNHNF